MFESLFNVHDRKEIRKIPLSPNACSNIFRTKIEFAEDVEAKRSVLSEVFRRGEGGVDDEVNLFSRCSWSKLVRKA